MSCMLVAAISGKRFRYTGYDEKPIKVPGWLQFPLFVIGTLLVITILICLLKT